MAVISEKLNQVPEGYVVHQKGDRFGLYKAGALPDDGEWLVSAPDIYFEREMRGLLGIFFEENLVENLYLQLLELFQKKQ
jgi:hypothetical protein